MLGEQMIPSFFLSLNIHHTPTPSVFSYLLMHSLCVKHINQLCIFFNEAFIKNLNEDDLKDVILYKMLEFVAVLSGDEY